MSGSRRPRGSDAGGGLAHSSALTPPGAALGGAAGASQAAQLVLGVTLDEALQATLIVGVRAGLAGAQGRVVSVEVVAGAVGVDQAR